MDRPTPPPDDFESLRRLLATKRHERPPPGYFDDFSTRVMARIAREEEMRARSWWHRWSESFFPGALLVPANALTLCGLVFVGASLYLVLRDRGPRGAELGVVRKIDPSPRPAGWAPGPPSLSPSTGPAVPSALLVVAPPLEAFSGLQLAPVRVDPETNEIPRDLFTLPSIRGGRGVSVETPQLLLPPR